MNATKTAKNWLSQNIDEETRKGIEALLQGSPALLEDAFYQNLEFGTGGMRGVMGVGPNRVNKYTLGMATQGLANYLKQCFSDEEIKVAIAHDCRNNSQSFARLVADVFTANGIRVFLFPALRPTPQLSFAVRHLHCHSGIVITASHNPPEYNGYKVYWSDGAQIVAPHDQRIIEEVGKIQRLDDIRFTPNDTLLTWLDERLDEAFICAALAQRKTAHPPKNSGLRIVFTPLHGTSVTLMPALLKHAGHTDLHIVEAQATPNGNFPTVKSPNPEEREALDMALTLADKVGADLVVGTDPDSDRLGVAIRDNQGQMLLLNGNQCGVLLTDYLLKNTQRNGSEFIAYTIVSSEMFGDVARAYNTGHEVCLTGFKYIASLIRKNEGRRTFVGGGEESYGYMVGDFVRDKDALTSTLLFCDLAAEAKAKGSSAYQMLCDLYAKHGFYYEHLISITKKGKDGAAEIKALMERFRSDPPSTLDGERVVRVDDIRAGCSRNLFTGVETTLNLPPSNVLQFFTESGTKVSARPSGTEPKIKFYFSVKAKWNASMSYSAQEKILRERTQRIMEDLKI